MSKFQITIEFSKVIMFKLTYNFKIQDFKSPLNFRNLSSLN